MEQLFNAFPSEMFGFAESEDIARHMADASAEHTKIAKILRKFCVQENIKKLQVCYTKQIPMKFDCNIIGSVVYYPVNMASVICAKVINDIIKG